MRKQQKSRSSPEDTFLLCEETVSVRNLGLRKTLNVISKLSFLDDIINFAINSTYGISLRNPSSRAAWTDGVVPIFLTSPSHNLLTGLQIRSAYHKAALSFDSLLCFEHIGIGRLSASTSHRKHFKSIKNVLRRGTSQLFRKTNRHYRR